MKQIISPIKGTRDFYPENMAVRSWLYENIKQISQRYGYQEYDGPFLEPIELYAAKSGEELVKEQSFVFPDRSGDLITLRPELTPTLARMVAQKQKQLVFPLRWWSFGPFWRYEKPQKGRSREFFQWNIDLIGIDTPEADAELLSIIVSFFKAIGLSAAQVKIFINDRKLMEEQLCLLDIPPERHTKVFRLIDRKEKMEFQEWESYAKGEGLSSSQINGLINLLHDTELWKNSPNLIRIFQILETEAVSEYIEFDPNIIRGLDYYTSTVFEAKDVGGSVRRSILGGGRYDDLLAAVGGDPLPAVGFAMGDVVLSLILQEYGCIPSDIFAHPARVLVTTFSQEMFPYSLKLAHQLREKGINVVTYPEAANLNKQLKYADRMQIPYVILLGPDEIAQNSLSLKSLKSGEQIRISFLELDEKLLPILAG
ncbi:MAG: histidine--tRNA ligase [Anaerolineales bacterium]|nr:histidine--tRNA ligase [Anaerolineales bacterium]MDW8161031.1 histidine--tRNA ligase [Anaerolineales bacterium]